MIQKDAYRSSVEYLHLNQTHAAKIMHKIYFS